MKFLGIIISVGLLVFCVLIINQSNSSKAELDKSLPSARTYQALEPTQIPIQPSYPTFTPTPTIPWQTGKRTPTREEILVLLRDAMESGDDELFNNTLTFYYLMYPNYFHGYRCETDCSGHEAGYNWAIENDIDDDFYCINNSESFQEGCEIFVEERYL